MRRLAITLAVLAAACSGSEPVPAGFAASVVPSRVWYQTGQRVELQGAITDQEGMPITSGVEVVWTVEPASAALPEDRGPDPRNAAFTLVTEGRTTFTGCVVPTEEGVLPWLCDSLTIRVDDGMPVIELTSPLPGAEIDDPEGILVEGSVSDRSMVRVYVEGQAVEVDPMGRFSTRVPATFGVNHLVIAGSDGLTDPSAVELDVLYANAFSPAVADDGTPELVLDDGLRLWLGQSFFDDGERLDLAGDPLTTRDLADLLELVVASIDANAVIPDPVVDEPPSFTLRATNAVLADPEVELDLTETGADLFIRIGSISIDTQGALMVDSTSLPLTGTITGSAVAFARLNISKESEEAELEVTLDGLVVGLEGLNGDFVDDETNAVFLLVEGLLRGTIEDLLADAIRSTLEDSVPAVLRDALGAIDTALRDQSIELNAEPFPPVTMQIDGRITDLRTTYRGEMEVTMRTTIGTTTPATHPESRGVARLDTFPRGPRFYRDGYLKMGVRLAMMNGLLHALWSSGLLDVNVSPLLPEGITGLVSEASLTGRIPPVLRPPTPIETDDLILALGQLELDLVFMGQPVRYAVTIEAGVNVDLTANTLTIDLAEEPFLRVWTLVPPDDDRLLNEELVRSMLLDLWPDLRSSITGGLALELPLPGLGDLGGLAPDLADLTLRIDMTGPARPRGTGGTLVLDAAMTGTFATGP